MEMQTAVEIVYARRGLGALRRPRPDVRFTRHEAKMTRSNRSPLTLDETEITTARTSRRNAMTLIGGATLGAAVVTIAGTARAQEAVPLCSDSDPYDPAGYGR